jgi:general secretion pathway protein H
MIDSVGLGFHVKKKLLIPNTLRCNGFSLLEILIAMAIMAIMVVVAFPNLGQNSDKLAKKEILRLVAAIELVRDQSVILNQEYGLNIDEKGYQFLVLNEDDDEKPPEWQLIEENPALEKHDFPEGLDINLSIDGENAFTLSDDQVEIFEKDIEIFTDEEEQKKIEPPQIYFLSSGEQNQFSIAIAVKENTQVKNTEIRFYRVRGFLTGNLKYEGPLVGNLFQDIDREFEQNN